MDGISPATSTVPQGSCSGVNLKHIVYMKENLWIAPPTQMWTTYSSPLGPQIEHFFLHQMNKARSPMNPQKKTFSNTEESPER